jgi:hypothetical protein
MYVYFEYSVPLKVYSEVSIIQIFIRIVVIMYFALLPTTQIIFSVVAHSAEK